MCPDRIVPRRTSTASRTNWRKAALVTGGWWVVAIEDRQSDFPRSVRLAFENLDELACVRSLIALEGVGGRRKQPMITRRLLGTVHASKARNLEIPPNLLKDP